MNHPVQPALTTDVPADKPQILTPPPMPVPSSPVHLHAEHTDHVETPLTPLPTNASSIDDTTPNVVAPDPSDPEHIEEVPTRLQRMQLPPALFTYDTFQNPMFQPAAVSCIQASPIYGQLPPFIPYVPPAPPFIPSPPSLQPYLIPHYYPPIPIPAPRYYPPTPFVQAY